MHVWYSRTSNRLISMRSFAPERPRKAAGLRNTLCTIIFIIRRGAIAETLTMGSTASSTTIVKEQSYKAHR